MTSPTWYPIECTHGYDHCPECDKGMPIPLLEADLRRTLADEAKAHAATKAERDELLRELKLRPTDAGRFARIADAHSKNVDEHGGTWGDCNECGHVWPCPTYVWATTDRDPLATWDPADDKEPSP